MPARTRQAAPAAPAADVPAAPKETARYATPKETRAIQRILKMTARIRKLAVDRETAFAELAKKSGGALLAAELEVDGVKELRIFKVAAPAGKYVVMPRWDFVANRRPTKDDKALLEAAGGAA